MDRLVFLDESCAKTNMTRLRGRTGLPRIRPPRALPDASSWRQGYHGQPVPAQRREVDALIRATGAEPIFLPPYSPDFNPIESMWSKVKAYLRKAKARTAEALLTAIREALQTVTASDAHGWFKECGYVYSQG